MFQELTPFQPFIEARNASPGSSDQRSRRLGQLEGAKRAFTTRRVTLERGSRLLKDHVPQAGDLLLARVTNLGHHQKLETPGGRRSQLYVGDSILVAYGERYAPDQFEAVVPGDLDPCELVAGGGVAGKVLARHSRTRRPTAIRPLGLVAGRDGRPLNLRNFSLPALSVPVRRPRVIGVAGTSMNSGKTTTAAGLIHGLARAGLHVAAAKVTGTGSGNDYWSMLDAGARKVLDFTDMGHASTAGLENPETEQVALSLIAHCATEAPDVIVLELADGLLQKETAGLLGSAAMRSAVDGILFAARDAMGAVCGCDWLRARGHHIIGVSGLLTASPLATREAADAIARPVVTLADLHNPDTAPTLAFGSRTEAGALRACA